MAKVKFEGHEYEYDAKAVKSYTLFRQISRLAEDPGGFFDGMSRLFCGHDVEYAQQLGDDIDKMGELISAVMDDAGRDAKN